MKPSGALAVLLTITLPGGAFAQNLGTVRVGPAAESAASAAAGTLPIKPAGLGALTPLALSASPLAAGFTPSPVLSLTPALAAARSAPSAAQVIGAIPALPVALAASPSA